MSKISITDRWKLESKDPQYPKNDSLYKTDKCKNKWPCKFQGKGTCLFWHDESERDWWKYIRDTAERRGLQPAEINKEMEIQRNVKIQRQNLSRKGKLAVGSELQKKQKEVRGTNPFKYGLGGRKKRKSRKKRKRRTRRRIKRKKSSSKKHKSRKRRRTKGKKNK